MHAMIYMILQENPNSAAQVADQWFDLALCERDFDAAGRALAVMPESGYTNEGFAFPKSWYEGLFAQARGDTSVTVSTFARARSVVERTMHEQPDYAQALCLLGVTTPRLDKRSRRFEKVAKRAHSCR